METQVIYILDDYENGLTYGVGRLSSVNQMGNRNNIYNVNAPLIRGYISSQPSYLTVELMTDTTITQSTELFKSVKFYNHPTTTGSLNLKETVAMVMVTEKPVLSLNNCFINGVSSFLDMHNYHSIQYTFKGILGECNEK